MRLLSTSPWNPSDTQQRSEVHGHFDFGGGWGPQRCSDSYVVAALPIPCHLRLALSPHHGPTQATSRPGRGWRRYKDAQTFCSKKVQGYLLALGASGLLRLEILRRVFVFGLVLSIVQKKLQMIRSKESMVNFYSHGPWAPRRGVTCSTRTRMRMRRRGGGGVGRGAAGVQGVDEAHPRAAEERRHVTFGRNLNGRPRFLHAVHLGCCRQSPLKISYF